MGYWLILVFPVLFVSFKQTSSRAGNTYEWGYKGNHTPKVWRDHFPHCGGMRQSPIDISTDHVIYNENLGDLKLLNYNLSLTTPPQLINNGHSVQVNIEGDYFVEGGGLPSRYKVKQFHFHWGDVDRRGSEHFVDGQAFPMEMHVVHYSTEYSKISEAMNRPNGLAVLAVFFKVGQTPNKAFDKVISHLHSTDHKNDVVQLEPFSLRSLLPVDVSTFYRYSGSLTTPPCYESVIWSLYSNYVFLAESQLNQFRKLLQTGEDLVGNDVRLVNDFRPIQAMNARVVETNIPAGGRKLVSLSTVPFLGIVIVLCQSVP